MSLQGFYTTKGLALAAKLAAGTGLTITRVTAGSGQTAASAAALAQERQTLTVGEAAVSGQSAVLPATLAEAGASAAYTLTELGVYARDPQEGEILYQVFRLSEGRAITAGGGSAYRFYLKRHRHLLPGGAADRRGPAASADGFGEETGRGAGKHHAPRRQDRQ